MTVLIFSASLALVYLLVIRFLDVNEREPIWGITLLFALGFVAAGLVRFLLPGAVLELTVFPAAAWQEAAKFLALLVGYSILWMEGRTRGWSQINGPMDGIVYGAAVGLGFATGEAFVTSLQFGQEATAALGASTWAVFWTAALAGLAHGLFGAISGTTLAGVAYGRSSFGRVPGAVLGLSAAILANAGFRVMAHADSLGGTPALVRTWLALLLPLAFVVGVGIYALLREKRAIVLELGEERDQGVVTDSDLEILANSLQRQRRYWEMVLRGDVIAAAVLRGLHTRQVQLALTKRRVRAATHQNRRAELELEATRLRSAVRERRERLASLVRGEGSPGDGGKPPGAAAPTLLCLGIAALALSFSPVNHATSLSNEAKRSSLSRAQLATRELRDPASLPGLDLGSGRLAAVQDRDRDGISDADDRCPDQPETFNGFSDTDGCPDDFDDLIDLGKRTLARYWREELPKMGKAYVPPAAVRFYSSMMSTKCGRAKENNAAYCSADRSIYLHRPFMLQEFARGDFVPVVILAHEWGHMIQHSLGMLGAMSIFKELQADCLAGSYARFLDTQKYLDPGDMEEGRDLLFRIGSTRTPWLDPNAHGSSGQRIDAFTWGTRFGAASCTESVFRATAGSNIPWLDPTGGVPEGSVRDRYPRPAVGRFQLTHCKSRKDLVGTGITDAVQCKYRSVDGVIVFYEIIAAARSSRAQSLFVYSRDYFKEQGYAVLDEEQVETPTGEVTSQAVHMRKGTEQEKVIVRNGRLFAHIWGGVGPPVEFIRILNSR